MLSIEKSEHVKSSTTQLLLSCAVSALLCAPVGARAQATDAATDADVGAIEIVVTASKREQRLRDVPSAITALTDETLETQGVQSFRDYATLVPGLAQRDAGAPGYGTVILRGLSTGALQLSNTTAYYVDDAPFSSSGFLGLGGQVKPEPELGDIDRIEVLKGPQGTLYGASSLGGLIRIVSKRPDANNFSGNFRVEGTTVNHGNEGYAIRGSFNVPIVEDKLAMRVTGYYRRYPGWADNVGTGTKNVNDGSGKGVRAALRWTPTGDLSLDLVGIVQNIDTNGLAQQDNVSGTLTPLYGKRAYNNFFDSATSIRYRLATGTVDYDFGPVSLVTTASYANTRLAFVADYTPTYGFAFPPGVGVPVFGEVNMKKFSAESRLVSERLGAFEFVAGGFYTNEKSRYPLSAQLFDVSTNTPLPDGASNFLTALTASNYEEVAAFGNLTFYLTDDLDVTGGIRYAENTEDVDYFRSGALAPVFAGDTEFFSFKDSATTYLATLRWRPTTNLSTFLRAASGYRPGGPQTNSSPPPGAQVTIEPDTVWSYEAGVKASLIPGALDISASAYRIDWSDIQLNSLSDGFVLQGNGGDARVDGFELELTARPTQGLTVGANTGYTNARMTRIDPGPAAYLGAEKGDKLPLTPKWTAAIYADQVFTMSDAIEGTIGATLRYESDKPSSFSVAQLNPNVQMPSITTLDLRGGLRFEGFSMQLRLENLFDRNGYTGALTNKVFPGQVVPTAVTLIRPRSFIISLSAEF